MTDTLETLTRSYHAFRALGLPPKRAQEAAQAVISVLRDLDRAGTARSLVSLHGAGRGMPG